MSRRNFLPHVARPPREVSPPPCELCIVLMSVLLSLALVAFVAAVFMSRDWIYGLIRGAWWVAAVWYAALS